MRSRRSASPCSTTGRISTRAIANTRRTISRRTRSRRRACSCSLSTAIASSALDRHPADRRDGRVPAAVHRSRHRARRRVLFRRVGSAQGLSRARARPSLLRRARRLRAQARPFRDDRILRRRAQRRRSAMPRRFPRRTTCSGTSAATSARTTCSASLNGRRSATICRAAIGCVSGCDRSRT